MSEIARILREQDKIRRELRGLSGGRNLSFSAIENGAIADYDADGTLRTVIGRQPDGTHTVRHVDGPVPPQPTAPTVEVDGPVLRVAWDGQFAGGEQVPEDFSRVDVHVTAGGRETVAGNLTTREGSAVVVKAQQSGMHTVTLVARSLPGKSSPASEAVDVEVTVPSFSGAIEAVAQSANGKNVVTYASVPPTATDAGTEGDTWWVNEARLRDPDDPASEEYIAIVEQWRHDGTAWVPVELAHEVIASVDLGTATVGSLHGQRIVASTIDTEQLRSTAIDGMVITGATVQTSHEHPKTMMDPDGVHVTDEDGQDLVYLGRQIGVRGADGSTLAQISDDGMISGHALNVEADPVFMGDPLLGGLANMESTSSFQRTGWLDELARGVVAWGRFEVRNRSLIAGETAFGELQFRSEESRSYRITVEPITIRMVPRGLVRLRIRYTTDGSRPRLDSPELRFWDQNNRGPEYIDLMFGGSFIFDTQQDATVRLLLSFQSEKGGSVPDSGYSGVTRMIIEDMGMGLSDSGVDRTDKTTEAAPPPPPEKKNYTKTYTATAGRSWMGGTRRTDNTQYAYQGDGPYGGSQRSILLFPNMTGDLSGAEITSMRAYLYFEHWYYSSGGDARVHVHGQTSLPSSVPYMELARTEPNWPKPGGRWFPIPSPFWNDFKSGRWRGIGLGMPSGTRTEYGYARVSSAKIEVKYRK